MLRDPIANLHFSEQEFPGISPGNTFHAHHEILPPDINDSEGDFTVVGDKIRFGLAAVKNVGSGAISSMIKRRQRRGKFKSLYDFCEEVDARLINRRAIESLIKCGAFDSLGARRSQIMAVRWPEGRWQIAALASSLDDLSATDERRVLIQETQELIFPERRGSKKSDPALVESAS